jgi:feruloyl esterase
MGLAPQDLDEFYRFFRISGMDHCAGGDGAWQIGQTSLGAAGTKLVPQHNVLLRMVDWVENGNGPETVTGVKFNDVSCQIFYELGALLYAVPVLMYSRIYRPKESIS